MFGNNGPVLFPPSANESKVAKPSQEDIVKKKNAVSRLMRDLKEWQLCKHEFPCIEAFPLDKNIFEWHCNVCPDSGFFKHVIFHLIVTFDKEYPIHAPNVKLCTPIPHPNVFGDWICLDMLKRYEVGRYQGWTAAYCVTAILMQLQSFLFEQTKVDQMGYGGTGGTVTRNLNKKSFDDYYLPRIKSFSCQECKHSYTKPYPITPSMKALENNENNNNNNNKNMNSSYSKRKSKKSKKSQKNESDFEFWDGIYHDLEITILTYFDVKDLMKLKRVSRKFQILVSNSKVVQKEGLKCWFHRTLMIPSGKDESEEILCLGYGVKPKYYTSFGQARTLAPQIYCDPKNEEMSKICQKIKEEIGHFETILSIDTTFDLLSSDAFTNFKVRKSVFNDFDFTDFMPLYLYPKHGRHSMKLMGSFALAMYKKGNEKENENEKDKENGSKMERKSKNVHPWLILLTIGNIMKSLIVSVSEKSAAKGKLSLHYSVNIMETFFRLHHTLIAVYSYYREEIEPLLQHQIDLFFRKNEKGKYEYRNKRTIPDLGIFYMYLTLWQTENKSRIDWNEALTQLLDETFTRQVRWVLKKHDNLKDSNCNWKTRASCTWKESGVSIRLFMFNNFFFKEMCQDGKKMVKMGRRFEEYNANYGLPKNENSATRLQSFVKHIHCNVKNYDSFFKTIGLPMPKNGLTGVGQWLQNCLKQSAQRGYHGLITYTTPLGNTGTVINTKSNTKANTGANNPWGGKKGANKVANKVGNKSTNSWANRAANKKESK